MQKLLLSGFIVLLAGFGLIVIGGTSQGNSSAGGVVFIGPFPIVFGAGPGGWVLALMSVLIGVVTVALLLLWGWRETRMGGP